MSEGTIQGASAGVMLPDGSMWTGASGYADGAHQRPLQATDQFRVGSQTKTYTANLILQMADQGLVRLDQTLEQLVPTLNVPNAGRITVRDLLTMRSGIPEYLSAPSANQPGKLIREEWNDADGDVAYTAEQLVRQTNLVERRDEPPGTRMEYTNTNYALLGIIAEQASCRQATGCKTIGQLINQQVLARVPGIAGALYPTTNNPFTRPAVEGNSPTASGRVVNTTYSNPTVPGAAGALISTPRDELLWIREVVTNSNRLVSNATHQALIDSVTKAVRDGIIGGIVPVTYGYGLMSARSPGTGDEMIGHGGSLTGYTSQLFWLPELNMGFAVNVAGQPASFPKNLPYQYMGIAGLPSDDKAYSALPLYWMLQRNVVLASQAQGDCGNGAIGRVGSGQSATCSGDSVRTRPIVLEGSKLTVNDAGRHVTGATYGDDGVQGATSLLRPAVAFYGSNLEGIHLKGGATLNVQPMALVEATGVNSTAIRLTGGNNKLVVNGQVGAYGQGSKAILGDNGADDVTLGPDSKVFGDIDLGGGANRLVANGTVKGAIRYSGPDTRIAGTGALYTDVGGTTVSPGDGIGTLRVISLTGTGTTLEIETGKTGADLLWTATTADLTGAKLKLIPGADAQDGLYTIVQTQSSLSGTFAQVLNDSAVAAMVDVGPKDVRVATASPVLTRSATQAAQQMANRQLDTLERIITAPAVQGSRTALAAAPSATATDAAPASAAMGAIINSLAQAPVSVANESGLRVWANGFYDLGNVSVDEGLPAYDSRAAGFLAGGDAAVTGSIRLGVTFGYGSTTNDVDNRVDELEANAWVGGVYGVGTFGAYTVDAVALGGRGDNDSTRGVFNGIGVDIARGSFDDTRLAARLSGSRKLDGGGVEIEPKISLTFQRIIADSYRETGAGALSEIVGGRDASLLRPAAQLAFRKASTIDIRGTSALFVPEARIGLAQTWTIGDQDTDAAFTGFGRPFTVSGDSEGETALTLGTGFDLRVGDGVSLFANYDGELSSKRRDHRLNGGLRVRF